MRSVRVLVAVLAGVAASCSEGDAADQVLQKAEGPTEHSVHMERIRTLDCKGAFVCKQEKLLFITGEKPVEVGCFTPKDLNARQLALLGNFVYVANMPPLRAMVLRFRPPLKVDSQGRKQAS